MGNFKCVGPGVLFLLCASIAGAGDKGKAPDLPRLPVDTLSEISKYLDQKSVLRFQSITKGMVEDTQSRLVDRETRESRTSWLRFDSVYDLSEVSFAKVYDGNFEIQYGDEAELKTLATLLRNDSEFSEALVRLKLVRVDRVQKRGVKPNRYSFRTHEISSNTWAKLAHALSRTRLKEIDMSGNFIGYKGVSAIVRNPPQTLTHLNLRNNDLQNAALETLAGSIVRKLPELTHLDLSNSYSITDELIISPPSQFRESWPITLEAWRLLSEALAETQITHLNLNGQWIGDDVLSVLTPNLPRSLTFLSLRKNRITDEGVAAFTASELPVHLRKVLFMKNPIGRAGRQAFTGLQHVRKKLFIGLDREPQVLLIVPAAQGAIELTLGL